MYPVREFTHLDETFTPGEFVSADHPMVALRPDLFTTDKPKTPRKPKE